MGKPRGKRRETVRAFLRTRAGVVERCAGCGLVLPFPEATYLQAGGVRWAYCRPCAEASDPGGYVALLWGELDAIIVAGNEAAISERGRELPPVARSE